MTPIRILRHWRGHVVLTYRSKCYRVSGEGMTDGSWVIYGDVREVEEADVENEIGRVGSLDESKEVISALRLHWDSLGYRYVDESCIQ